MGRVCSIFWVVLVLVCPVLQSLRHSTSVMVLESELLSKLSDPFALERGGTLNFTIFVSASPARAEGVQQSVFVVLLNAQQVGAVNGLMQGPVGELYDADLCNHPFQMRQEVHSQASVLWHCTHPDVYTLALVSCANQPLFVQASLEFLNPGGQHLSVEDTYMANLFPLFALAYAHLILAWLWRINSHRDVKTIEYVFACALCVMLFRTVMFSAVYNDMSTRGELNEFSLFFLHCSRVMEDACFVVLMLVVACGTSFPHRFFVVLVILLVLEAVTASCGSLQMFGVLCIALQVMLFMVQFCILMFVIGAINVDLDALALSLSSASDRHLRESVVRRIKGMQMFRIAFLAFLFMPMIDFVVESTDLALHQKWPQAVVGEVASLAMYSVMGRCVMFSLPAVLGGHVTAQTAGNAEDADGGGAAVQNQLTHQW